MSCKSNRSVSFKLYIIRRLKKSQPPLSINSTIVNCYNEPLSNRSPTVSSQNKHEWIQNNVSFWGNSLPARTIQSDRQSRSNNKNESASTKMIQHIKTKNKLRFLCSDMNYHTVHKKNHEEVHLDQLSIRKKSMTMRKKNPKQKTLFSWANKQKKEEKAQIYDILPQTRQNPRINHKFDRTVNKNTDQKITPKGSLKILIPIKKQSSRLCPWQIELQSPY